MKTTVYNPRHLMSDQLLPNLIDQFFGMDEKTKSNSFFRPMVEIHEHDDAYEIYAALPGVKKSAITVDLKNQELLITGKKEKINLKEGTKIHLGEFQYGDFSRSFKIPELVNKAKIEAKFEDGILNIKLPKVKEAKPLAIKIS